MVGMVMWKIRVQLVLFVIFGCIGPWAIAAAQSSRLAVVQVTASGTSMTRNGAVTDALVNAINQVNGRVINEQTLAISLDAGFRTARTGTAQNSQGPHAAVPEGGAHRVAMSAGAYAKFVEEETHGAVKTYSVLSLNQNDRGVWIAEVKASITKFELPQQALRRSIAVLAARIGPSAISIQEAHPDGQGAGELITQGIVTGLTDSRKFTVLDREHTAATDSELSAITSGAASVDDYALLGKRLVADYILVTKVNRLRYEIEVTHFIDTSRVIRNGIGDVDAFYELIDPVTSQVVVSGTVAARLTASEMQRFGLVGSGAGAVQALTAYTGERIAKAITDDLYPIMIVQAMQNQVVIAEGGGSLRVGARYRVFEYGQTVDDPYTGESLGREESLCCVVQISRITPDLAYGDVSGLQKSFASIFRPGMYILRSEIKTSHAVDNKAEIEAIRRVTKEQDSVFDH